MPHKTPVNDSNTPEKIVETLRPNRRVFVGRPILRWTVLYAALATAAHFFAPLFFAPLDIGLLSWLGLATALTLFKAVGRMVTYRKTSYEFHADRLVVNSGTIATRSTVDLPYRNITQVILRLPFVEYRFFSTGHITVQTAGSSQGTAQLQSVDLPKKLYARIADHLRENGFSLARTRLVQREKPHIVGTFLDTSGMAVGGLIALFTLGLSVGGTVIDVMELSSFYELWDVLIGAVDTEDAADSEQAKLGSRATLGLAILAILAAVGGSIKLILHFIDLNRRTYTLWEDVVDYQDGFLTETRKFVPIENLADTSIAEPFLKRLLGMANVVLSPHGSSQGVSFPSMPRAAKFRDNLDRLIEESEGPAAPTSPTTSTSTDDESEAPAPDHDAPLAGTESRLPEVKGPPLKFRPYLLRSSVDAFVKVARALVVFTIIAALVYFGVDLLGLSLDDFEIPTDEIPFEKFPSQWVAPAAAALIALYLILNIARTAFFCFTTSYHVGRRKLSWVRDFISRDEVEFTTDKITTMEIEKTLTDRLMGTATLVFHTIGNTSPIAFEDVRKSDEKIEEIRRRLGLLPTTEKIVYGPRVTILDFLSARFPLILFYCLLAIGALIGAQWWEPAYYIAPFFVALIPLRLIRDKIFFSRCRLRLFEDHLEFQRGILRRHHHLIPFEQARSIRSLRYPGRTSGRLLVVPGSDRPVSLRYLEDIDALHEKLDVLLHSFPMRPVRQPEELDCTPVSRRHPLARNSVAAISLSLIGLPFLPILWPLTFLGARRTSIIVEKGRVRIIRGLLYRSTHTVLANRIDQLVMRRGLLNTLFKNGQVHVLTVGSTLPELYLGPVRDEKTLYEEIEIRVPGKSRN